MPNYAEDAYQQLATRLDVEDPTLLRLYTLLILTRGQQVTNAEVHDAWAVWRSIAHPAHPSCVPYPQLDAETQQLDTAYRDTIRQVAADLDHHSHTGRTRPFRLHRHYDVSGASGTGVVADGVEFGDGTVVVRWRGAGPSTVVWPSLEAAMERHGHDGNTTVLWNSTDPAGAG